MLIGPATRYLLRKTYLSKGSNITMSWSWKRSYSSLRPQFTYLIFIYIHSHLFITLRVYLEPITNAALVLHRSWVLIPYRPKFFSGLLLTTAQIVFVFVKIAFMFTSLSAVHIYDFHMLQSFNSVSCRLNESKTWACLVVKFRTNIVYTLTKTTRLYALDF